MPDETQIRVLASVLAGDLGVSCILDRVLNLGYPGLANTVWEAVIDFAAEGRLFDMELGHRF